MRTSRAYRLLAALCFLLFAPPALPNSDPQVGVQIQIMGIANSLELFKLDYCRFPTQSEGLEVLAHPAQATSPPCQAATSGYYKETPVDPWHNPIHYRFPGIHNPDSFDLWTLGADGVVGGLGQNMDRGNWERDDEGFEISSLNMTYVFWLIILLPGFVIGFPLFAFHSAKRYGVNQSFRESLIGDHLSVFAYIFCWTAFLLFAMNLLFS